MGQFEHKVRLLSRYVKLCGPTRQFCAAAHCVLDGPMRAARMYMTVHEMGPFWCLRVISFVLLWANSSSSTMVLHLHHGPIRA